MHLHFAGDVIDGRERVHNVRILACRDVCDCIISGVWSLAIKVRKYRRHFWLFSLTQSTKYPTLRNLSCEDIFPAGVVEFRAFVAERGLPITVETAREQAIHGRGFESFMVDIDNEVEVSVRKKKKELKKAIYMYSIVLSSGLERDRSQMESKGPTI